MYRIPALGLYRGHLVSIGYALCDPIGGISIGSYKGGSLWDPRGGYLWVTIGRISMGSCREDLYGFLQGGISMGSYREDLHGFL